MQYPENNYNPADEVTTNPVIQLSNILNGNVTTVPGTVAGSATIYSSNGQANLTIDIELDGYNNGTSAQTLELVVSAQHVLHVTSTSAGLPVATSTPTSVTIPATNAVVNGYILLSGF